jgi:hypothetical protein
MALSILKRYYRRFFESRQFAGAALLLRPGLKPTLQRFHGSPCRPPE